MSNNTEKPPNLPDLNDEDISEDCEIVTSIEKDDTFVFVAQFLADVKTPNFDLTQKSKRAKAIEHLQRVTARLSALLLERGNPKNREELLLLSSQMLVMLAKICKKHEVRFASCIKTINEHINTIE